MSTLAEPPVAAQGSNFPDAHPTLAVDLATLSEGERFWRDHHLWLKEKGYQLRPRYEPNWVASWLSGNVDESLGPPEDRLMTHVSDVESALLCHL